MHIMKDSFWKSRHIAAAKKVKSFTELAELALAILSQFNDSVVMVSGPISTGGRGSIEKNIEAFAKTKAHLEKRGHLVFSQTPVQETIARLAKEWRKANNKPLNRYCRPILTEFYLPIFKSGRVVKMFFRPDWKSSIGSRWERKKARLLRIEIEDLGPRFDKKLALTP